MRYEKGILEKIMKRFSSNLKVFILLFTVLLTSACKFPDNLPQIQGIIGFKFDNLKFGHTTIEDFKKLAPDAVGEKKGKSIVVFNTESADKDLYKAVRVGFKDNKLDWVEFVFNNEVQLSKIVEIYGKPRDINSSYSKQLDYYDYDFFNISTDKKQALAKCINLFGMRDSIQEQPKITIIEGIPDLAGLDKKNFLGLMPGLSLETEFKDSYPDLPVHKKEKFDGMSTYILKEELGEAKSSYKNINIIFNNGLLSWINLVPQNLSLTKAFSLYGSKYKIENIDSRYDIYHYTNVVMVVDKHNKKVINIGILGSTYK